MSKPKTATKSSPTPNTHPKSIKSTLFLPFIQPKPPQFPISKFCSFLASPVQFPTEEECQDPNVLRLMKLCLERNPDIRITAAALMRDEWLFGVKEDEDGEQGNILGPQDNEMSFYQD